MNPYFSFLIKTLSFGLLRSEDQQRVGAIVLSLALLSISASFLFFSNEEKIDSKYIYDPSKAEELIDDPVNKIGVPEQKSGEKVSLAEIKVKAESYKEKPLSREELKARISSISSSAVSKRVENLSVKIPRQSKAIVQMEPVKTQELTREQELYERILNKDLNGDIYAVLSFNRFPPLVIALHAHLVPETVANFVGLSLGVKDFFDLNNNKERTRRPFYDGLIIHRVVKGFVIQGGDPYANGYGGPGFVIPEEFHPSLKHDQAGIVSMANSGPNSTGSQFFITLGPHPEFDGHYSIFGKVIDGMNTVFEIEKVKTNVLDFPMHSILISNIEIYETKEDLDRHLAKVSVPSPAESSLHETN